MAKVLHVGTILIIAFSILQESAGESTTLPTTKDTGQNKSTAETPHPPSTTTMSTSSTFTTNFSRTVSQSLNEVNTTNSTSPETSIDQRTTSSPSLSTITTAEQTKTTSMDSQDSGNTALRTTESSSVKPLLSSTIESGKTVASTENLNTTPSSASSNNGEDTLARNPGLVAILSIFFIILALVIVVAISKIATNCRKSSQFERLDDLPMNKMNEDAPFAQYPPK